MQHRLTGFNTVSSTVLAGDRIRFSGGLIHAGVELAATCYVTLGEAGLPRIVVGDILVETLAHETVSVRSDAGLGQLVDALQALALDFAFVLHRWPELRDSEDTLNLLTGLAQAQRQGSRRLCALLRGGLAETKPFSQLGVPEQLAMTHYMAVQGDAWAWLVEGYSREDAHAPEFLPSLELALPRYVAAYGMQLFGTVTLPAIAFRYAALLDAGALDRQDQGVLLPERVAASPLRSPGEAPLEHGAEHQWPVILDADDQTLQDGWHRLNGYLEDGRADIPAMFYPDEARFCLP